MSEENIERLLYGGPTPRVKLRRRIILLALMVAGMAGAYMAGRAEAHGVCKLSVPVPYMGQGLGPGGDRVRARAQLSCNDPHYVAEIKMRLIRTPVADERFVEEETSHDGRHGGPAVDWIFVTAEMPCYPNWQYKALVWGQAGANGRHDFGPVMSEPVVLC